MSDKLEYLTPHTSNAYRINVSLCILESKIFAKDVSKYQVSSLE